MMHRGAEPRLAGWHAGEARILAKERTRGWKPRHRRDDFRAHLAAGEKMLQAVGDENAMDRLGCVGKQRGEC